MDSGGGEIVVAMEVGCICWITIPHTMVYTLLAGCLSVCLPVASNANQAYFCESPMATYRQAGRCLHKPIVKKKNKKNETEWDAQSAEYKHTNTGAQA